MLETLETRAVYEGAALELRQDGRTIGGTFPYAGTATVADRGRVRKERILPGAFDYTIRDETREVNLLAGHLLSQPLASKRAGSLVFRDGPESLDFTATLPPEPEQPSWMQDSIKALRLGLIRGLSPGFRIPPRSAVPDAEDEEPEEGNPGVFVRLLRQVVLFEFSLVTRAAYEAAGASLRDGEQQPSKWNKRRGLWQLT